MPRREWCIHLAPSLGPIFTAVALHDAADLTLERLLVCTNAVRHVDVRFPRSAVGVAFLSLPIGQETGGPLLLAALLKEDVGCVLITPFDVPNGFCNARDGRCLVHPLESSVEMGGPAYVMKGS